MQWTLSARLQGVYMYLYFSVNICKTVPYMYTYVHTQSVLIYLKHFFVHWTIVSWTFILLVIEQLPVELRDRFTDMREMDLQVQSKFDVMLYIFCMSNIMYV